METASDAGGIPGISGGSGTNTFGGDAIGFAGATLITGAAAGGGGVTGAGGGGGGGTKCGVIAIGGGGAGAGVGCGVGWFISGTVPHGCSTLPPRTVTGTDAVSPPAVTLTVVVPGLKAHSSPEVAVGDRPCRSSPEAACEDPCEFGSCSTKFAMSGREDVNVYCGATKLEQLACRHGSGGNVV